MVRKTAAQLLVPRRSLWSSKPEGRAGQKGKVTNTEIVEVSYESKPTDHNTKTITNDCPQHPCMIFSPTFIIQVNVGIGKYTSPMDAMDVDDWNTST